VNKSYRDGIDLEVAFASEMKRVRAAAPPSVEPAAAEAPRAHEPPLEAPHRDGAFVRLLRTSLTAAYRWTKAAMRPLAFRIRRYLSAPLLQDVHHAQTLLEDVRLKQAALQQDLRRVHAALLREVKQASDRLEGDVQSARNAAIEDVRSVGDRTVGEVGALRDAVGRDLASFSDNLSRTLALTQQSTVKAIGVIGSQIQSSVEGTERAMATLQDTVRAAGVSNLDRLRDLQGALLRDWAELQAAAQRQTWEAENRLISRLDRIERYSLASARRVAINCGDGILVRTEVGYVLCPLTDYALVARLVETGELERGTRQLLTRLLEPGHVFVDVGANVGLHTLAACRALGGGGRVIAFEPFAPTVELLRKSIWINGFADVVDVRQSAVSSHEGRQPLFLGATTAHHSLIPLTLHTGADPSSVEVPTIPLDRSVDFGHPVSVIKIDVEGAELAVLAGARALIEHNPDVAIIVEFGPSHLARGGVRFADWFSAFERIGLVHRRIDDDTGALISEPAEMLERLGAESANLLFSRPGSPAWARAEAIE
jgi:FkbM family methyltransferase